MKFNVVAPVMYAADNYLPPGHSVSELVSGQ